MTTDRAEFSEVLAAVRAYAAGCKFGMQAPDMCNDIARQLSVNIRMQSAVSRLTSQIRRALNSMAVAGELVKESDGNSASYYTPEAMEWRRGENARRAAEVEEDRQRRRSLHARLSKLGLSGSGRFVNDGLGIARVDLSLLEALADLAERNGEEQDAELELAEKPYAVTELDISCSGGVRDTLSRHKSLAGAVEAWREAQRDNMMNDGMPDKRPRVEHDGRPVDTEAYE